MTTRLDRLREYARDATLPPADLDAIRAALAVCEAVRRWYDVWPIGRTGDRADAAVMDAYVALLAETADTGPSPSRCGYRWDDDSDGTGTHTCALPNGHIGDHVCNLGGCGHTCPAHHATTALLAEAPDERTAGGEGGAK